MKAKLIAGLVAVLLVIVPLGGVFSVIAIVGGAAQGVSASLAILPVNCKAPFNIFDAWDTFEDFITGVDCDECQAAAPPSEGGAGQAEYVQTIIGVGKAMNIPDKGMTVALITVLAESGLKNYANDGIYDTGRNPADATLGPNAPNILSFIAKSKSFPHDAVGSDATSVGLFQQQAWWGTMGKSNWENDPEGTIKRLMDPAFQAQKFFNVLISIPGWEDLPPGVAAQRVQVSAFPDAYIGHVPTAVTLYNENKDKAKDVELYDFGETFEEEEGGEDKEESDGGTGCGGGGGSSSTGIVLEKSSLYQITAQFSQPRGAELLGAHRGMDIDCGDEWEDVFTPVSGTVTIATNGNPSGYGSPAGQVMIKTEEGTVMQLYHMRNVFVKAGDQVEGGQAIGECASTGLSTGTHLHIEAYMQYSTNPAIAALPVGPYVAASENKRDPALILDIMGVDICPPYVADRKLVEPGSPLPGGIMKCWPPEEWTR